MLKSILSITGKPGLFKIVAHSNKNLIVEDLINKKRFPVSMRDRVVSLGDITMYTDSGDMPLPEIMEKVKETENGAQIDTASLIANKELREKFKSIIPDFDEDKVRDNDIKKLFNWYNILISAGMSDFIDKKEEKEESAETPSEEK